MEIEMSYQNDTELKEFEEAYFENVAKVIFNHLNLDGYFIYEVNLVDLDFIHKLNREHRNIDRPTDVISFAFEDEVEGAYAIIKDVNIPRVLGEIFICVDKAKEQAASYGHSFEREMSFLFTHGLLHLLGYDHIQKEDEEIMFKLQEMILNEYGIKKNN
jgi:probable rRNA maturation factor